MLKTIGHKRYLFLFILTAISTFPLYSTSHSNPINILNNSPDSLKKSETLNTIDLIDIEENLFAISVSIGYPPQKFLMQFDISSEYTWVAGPKCRYCSYEHYFNETVSETAITTNTTILLEDSKARITGEIIFDYINMKIFSANNLPFLIVNEDIYLDGLDGSIGFGYSKAKSQRNFSILDKLYSNKQIINNLFSLKFSQSSLPDKLILGMMPQEVENDMKNYTVCNVDENMPNWNCRISHLIVGKDVNFYNAMSINKLAMFSSTLDLMNVPVESIQFFMQNYFNYYPNYSNDMCKIKPDGQKFYIMCNIDLFDLNEAPPLHLIMNGYAYFISQYDLFKQVFSDSYIKYYLFKIVFKSTPNSQWVLGYSFMKHYLMVFDKEKSQVGFYAGIKYDLRKFTRDSIEIVCLYNYSVYIFIASLVGISMWYIIHKKKQDEILVTKAIIEEISNKENKKEKDYLKIMNISGKKTLL